MIAAEQIAHVLGVDHKVHSLRTLARLVAKGLPKASLLAVASRVFDTSGERRALMHRLVSEATYKRRDKTLKPAESERAERLARVIATAEYVWDDKDDAREFLVTPHPRLGNDPPFVAALTELGAREVEEILWQIFYGLPA